jgi:hypothetical protein
MEMTKIERRLFANQYHRINTISWVFSTRATRNVTRICATLSRTVTRPPTTTRC